jgi:hypothetical protein
MEFGGGKVNITMPKHIEGLIKDFPPKRRSKTPHLPTLFKVDPKSPLLSKVQSADLHTAIMRLKFPAERVRPEILPAVSFLASRVRNLTEEDAVKFMRVIEYLADSPDRPLTLEIDPKEGPRVYSYVDAAHAVHGDFRDQIGTVISLGKGALVAKSKKGLNTKSSTEGELVGLSDHLSPTLGIRNFLIGQGHVLQPPARMYEDNESTIALIKRGMPCSDKTRHFNIRLFLAKRFVDAGELEIVWCSTEEQVADALSKPVQGRVFVFHRDHGLLNNSSSQDRFLCVFYRDA